MRETKKKADASERLANVWKKRYYRLRSSISATVMKTEAQANVSVTDSMSISDQVKVAQCVLGEINESIEINKKSRKHLSSVRRVICGKIIKKYRCGRLLNKALGISRRRLTNELDKSQSSVQSYQRIAKETHSLVLDFYERDEISRCMPGKNDSTKSNGSRKQARILNDYLRNVYLAFNAAHVNVKVSFSVFCKLRPKHVKLTNLLSRNTCLCIIHQNMALKFKCLRTNHAIKVTPNPDQALKNISDDQFEDMLCQNITENVVYFEQWKRVDADGKKKTKLMNISL